MGISIDVRSILPRKGEHHPPMFYPHQAFILEKIRESFDWEIIPWEEPSEKEGLTDTSCSWSRFNPLIGVATAITNNIDASEIDIDQIIKQELGEKENRRFPHFLRRSKYSSIYLPVDVNEIVFFDDDEGTVVSVGSSAKLEKELLEIQSYLKRVTLLKGKDQVYSQSSISWIDLMDLVEILLKGTRESQVENLPFELLW